MINKEQLDTLLCDNESYRVEKTISTTNMDKFCEAICAFANDLPNKGECGYLLIGVNDDNTRCGLKVTDELLIKITNIRSDGNILPLPQMSVDTIHYDDGDVLVVEITPSKYPPVRYRGRTCVRIGPRKGYATLEEERILMERCAVQYSSFDTRPCLEATIDDIDTKLFQQVYLPLAISEEVLERDNRSIKEQMAALRLYNLKYDCPTNAAIILFGKNPKYFLMGDYIQFVRYNGSDNSADIINQYEFNGNLCSMLPKLDTFIETSLIQNRPLPTSALKEKSAYNYPQWAIRELLMNAVMHREYQTHTPTKLYQYNDRIEIVNAGGLYGNATPDNFPMVNDYRNPIVAEILKVLGYVNKFNRGIARVKSDLIENGNGEANFRVDKRTVFEVIINDASAMDEPTTKTSVKTSVKTSTKTSVKLLEAIETNPNITRTELAELLHITPQGVGWQIEQLKKKGFIRREGSNRNGRLVIIKKE